MKMINSEQNLYEKYIAILKEELIPAMGCTEPIAVALAAAKARDMLGHIPDKVELEVSGSIIKNVKSVIVPHTDNMRGIEAAAAIGIIGGRSEHMLNCLADVTEEQQEQIKNYIENTEISVGHTDEEHIFDIIITEHYGDELSKVRIVDDHTNIVYIQKNDEIIYNSIPGKENQNHKTDRSCLNVVSIWEFINKIDWERLKEIQEPQVNYNMAISREGLNNAYGANVGKSLLHMYGDNVKIMARAAAAAGSDARMNGCEMPVIINSGSGNQGITASVPVVVYARRLKVSEEEMYRALALSNLITIHLKTGIGTLSAYCGAMSAGTGAGCGIAYLQGSDLDGILHTIINAQATVSGVICDGAKASCAAKIATAVEAGINGYYMYLNDNNFKAGDGIVGEDVESTIKNIGRLASEGMKSTNDTIIDIMIEEL